MPLFVAIAMTPLIMAGATALIIMLVREATCNWARRAVLACVGIMIAACAAMLIVGAWCLWAAGQPLPG